MARHSIPDIIDQAEPRQGELRTDARPVAWLVIRSLRPEQWTKNLIIFGGLLFGQRLFDLHSAAYATAAFAVFCALSGVVYLLNDVADRDADRRHPLKRHRPIASGELSTSTALVAAGIIGIGGLASAFLLRLQQEWGEKDAPHHPASSVSDRLRTVAAAALDQCRVAGVARRHPAAQRTSEAIARQTAGPLPGP